MKIYVSDLDGTLLTSNRKLPPDFAETLKLIDEANDMFFFASGRSYEDVSKYLKDIDYPLNAICDNGAEVYINNQPRYECSMDKDDVKLIVETFIKNDFGILMLSTPTQTYKIMPTTVDPLDNKFLEDFYTQSIEISSYDEIKDDVFKIAICTNKGSYEYLFDNYKDLTLNSTKLTVSGFDWIDFVNSSVNKGNAIKHIIELLDVTKDDIYCFGDYLNDINMCEQSNHTYAMANAHPTIIELFNETIKSNDEFGVTCKIKELLKTK